MLRTKKVWYRESAGEEKKNKAKSRANKQKDEREGQEARRERWNPTANMTASHAANTNTANRQQTDRQTVYRTRPLRAAWRVGVFWMVFFFWLLAFGICGGHRP